MKKNLFNPLVCALVLAVGTTTSCKQSRHATEKEDALVSHIDSTTKAGDDFFQFANGKWFKENPIPASEQSNGIFQLVQDTINAQVRNICELAAADRNEPKGSNKQKIGDLFFSGMDSVSLNKKGLSDLKNDFARIDALKDLKGVLAEAAYIHTVSSSPLFGFYVAQDDKNSAKYQVYIVQGGLSMPDRNYYLDTDESAKNIREKYVEYVNNMFGIMGYKKDEAKQSATKLMEMETALAKTSRKREDTRDPLTNYHKMSFAKLNALTPNIDWKVFMNGIGLAKVDSVVVGQPEFLTALNRDLKKYTINDWKNYLKFHFLNGLAPYLDDKTYTESFNFYSATLRGIKEPKPRWKRVVSVTNGALGDLVGQVYVSEYLPKGTKEKLLEIGNAIKSVFAQRIKELDWMSAPTKEKALKKLNAVIMKVGYPDKWKDLSSMQIDRTSYVKNVMNANKWEVGYMINKYGKPVDRTEWDMEPQTYNAYYNPSNNEIVIPGCNIIVPGYERKMADDAILYGIIGGTFGHEITHGFDDQGCKYNEYGNLSDWWTKEDKAKFEQKTKMIVQQFNDYVPVDSLHINGSLTQGENIADLGGVIMGYEAFKKTKQYKTNEMIAGLNPSQRFFLGYALTWMVNMRPEAMANQIKSNEHAPAKWRVLGPLSNMPEFYETFGVKKGDKMWRPDSLIVKIW
ncbi:M13 family metallopeptidase [uncultured Bacteroides sp.]|uniref:M13 family metallopeptidase n=1 Tax=uncultured Bacteroides sp. TaxID=162156 RepID=UPI002AABF7C0|nr:M13 family metallopeptidase [uncultured Bacteroides sp.]